VRGASLVLLATMSKMTIAAVGWASRSAHGPHVRRMMQQHTTALCIPLNDQHDNTQIYDINCCKIPLLLRTPLAKHPCASSFLLTHEFVTSLKKRPQSMLDADTASAAELLAALEEGGGVQGDDKWKRLGIDFDNWNWWQKEAGAQTKRSTSMKGLDDPQVSMHVKEICMYVCMLVCVRADVCVFVRVCVCVYLMMYSECAFGFVAFMTTP